MCSTLTHVILIFLLRDTHSNYCRIVSMHIKIKYLQEITILPVTQLKLGQ